MWKLLRDLGPYKGMLYLVGLVLLLQSLADLYLPALMAAMVNNGMMKGDTAYIWWVGRYMLLVALGGSLCSIAASLLAAMIGMGFGRDIRERVFARVSSYSLHEIDQIGTASLITRTTNDITQVQSLLVMGLRFMVMAPLMCVGGIIMAYLRDPALTRLLAVVLPLMLVAIVLIARLVVPLFKAMQVKLDKVNLVLRENLTGIRVIRAFNRLSYETGRFGKANRELTDNAIKVNRIMAGMHPLMNIVMNLTSVAIVWFGGLRIGQGVMEIGDMMAFIQYAMLIMFSIIMVTVMFVMLPRAEASAIRINEVLELEADIVDPAEPQTVAGERGRVEFRQVSFSYPEAIEPVLKDISFVAEPGEVTAIIGGTGAGKSTLINLIPRFYDVGSGQVLVEGVDVRETSQASLRSKIGFVPQIPVLFTGTVAENIRYGKPEADEAEIHRAAGVAQASDFIEAMPLGYEAVIAQGGQNLSGGQKQRLSIARALIRQTDILILDDSFSALDYKTDARLRQALQDEVSHNSTVIIVAQRVSTVIDADQILVLDEGQVVGIGKHRELLKSCKVYQEIVFSQLSEEEIA